MCGPSVVGADIQEIRRTRDGVHETSIQLAEKILDCDGKLSQGPNLGVV